MFAKITESQFIKDYKNNWFYKPARAAFYLTATVLIVAALAAAIFYVGPFMLPVATGLLYAAKWTAITCAGAGLICLGELIARKAWVILERKMASEA